MQNTITKFTILVFIAIYSAISQAKTLVCIDAGNNDGYLTSAEGYYRSTLEMPPDRVILGGTINACLANAEAGDTIIIVSHGAGAGGVFEWGGSLYSGFGAGTGVQVGNPAAVTPYVLQAAFLELAGITVQHVACWSSRDPNGPNNQSVTASLNAALTGAGSSATGFQDEVQTGAGIRVTGGTPAQRAAAEAYLGGTDDSWMDFPPVNRPNTNINQQTQAQQILDAQFAGQGLQAEVVYREPFNIPPQNQQNQQNRGITPSNATIEICGLATPFIAPAAEEFEVPMLNIYWKILAMAALVFVAGLRKLTK